MNIYKTHIKNILFYGVFLQNLTSCFLGGYFSKVYSPFPTFCYSPTKSMHAIVKLQLAVSHLFLMYTDFRGQLHPLEWWEIRVLFQLQHSLRNLFAVFYKIMPFFIFIAYIKFYNLKSATVAACWSLFVSWIFFPSFLFTKYRLLQLPFRIDSGSIISFFALSTRNLSRN